MYRAHIVFDCDGTLISSQKQILATTAKVFGEILGREVEQEELQRKYDPHLEILLGNFGIHSKEDLERARLSWQSKMLMAPLDYQLFDGILPLLQFLKEEQMGIYVWTARDRASTQRILTDLKVWDLFDDVRTSTCTFTKPHPQGIEDLVGQFPKKDILMIGDTYVDVLGARNFGVKSVGAYWCDYVDHARLRQERPNFHCNHPMEIAEIVEQLFLNAKN